MYTNRAREQKTQYFFKFLLVKNIHVEQIRLGIHLHFMFCTSNIFFFKIDLMKIETKTFYICH